MYRTIGELEITSNDNSMVFHHFKLDAVLKTSHSKEPEISKYS